MQKNEETLVPLLNQGMREVKKEIEQIMECGKDMDLDVNNALVSIMNMKRSLLSEIYYMILTADFVHKQHSATDYKQELLTTMSLLRVAESLLIRDMEELSEQLQGGKEILTGWLDYQIERD